MGRGRWMVKMRIGYHTLPAMMASASRQARRLSSSAMPTAAAATNGPPGGPPAHLNTGNSTVSGPKSKDWMARATDSSRAVGGDSTISRPSPTAAAGPSTLARPLGGD